MEWYTLVIAVSGGFLAGCINTLAGNGSAITLSILTEIIGLPGNIANGTNRIGIQFQSMASAFSFLKNKKGQIEGAGKFVLIAICGALVGVYIAISVTSAQFMSVFRILLAGMLVVTIVNPKRWLIPPGEAMISRPIFTYPAFFILGLYGGFIQMGMGVFFLAVTVLIMRINIIEANAIKTYIIAVYTLVVIGIFEWNGLIDWKIGLIIAAGQVAGGYLTAEFASKYKGADKIAYRLLIAVIILALLSTYNIL